MKTDEELKEKGCGKRFKSKIQGMQVTCGGNVYNPNKELCPSCKAKQETKKDYDRTILRRISQLQDFIKKLEDLK